MLMAVNYDKQAMLPEIETVIKNMFHDPSDVFYTGKVMDILFDGVPIDCETEHGVTAAICLSFDDNPNMRKIDDFHYAFSLFGSVSWIFDCFF